MEYTLDLNPRPFESIKNGTKKVEGRTPTEYNKHIPFDKIKRGDFIIFINNENQEKMKTHVLNVRHYKDVRSMLEKEGVENVLSSKGTIEEGIESYHKFTDYEKNIKKFGIYAIEIKVM